jgi:hypothetical protein
MMLYDQMPLLQIILMTLGKKPPAHSADLGDLFNLALDVGQHDQPPDLEDSLPGYPDNHR